jgi:hypothetical protein
MTELGRQEDWGIRPGLPPDPADRVVELPRRLRGHGVIAHIGALPLEEVLPVLTGAGSGLLAVRAWIMPRVRRRRDASTPRCRET